MLAIQAEQERLANNAVRFISGSGAPVDGATGTGVPDCGMGSQYVDIATGFWYTNYGTKTSPRWGSSDALKQVFSVVLDFSAAQINAGANVLAAIAGLKPRMIDYKIIAKGGAASGATDVRLLATQAAGSVALVTTVIAGLTQSTVNRDGAANNSVLADGASYAANDVSTALTIGKTGGSFATATGVRIILHFTLE